jgi:hypothetical protein
MESSTLMSKVYVRFLPLSQSTAIQSFQDNVLISPAGIPMLSDFSVSSVFATSISDPTSNKGSARWMAIEFYSQLQGTSSDTPKMMIKPNEKTDTWAFGMTVYVGGDS